MTITKVITDDGLAKVTQLAKSTFIAKTDTLEANEVELATVATSGSFADLSNKPIVDQVYDNTSANAQSGVAVKSAIDAAISSVYKPGGSIIFENLPNISSSILGYVYNISEAFTTTSDFVEGSGRTYPAGTNIVLVDLGNNTLKWDVLSGLVDLSGYQLANTAVTHTASTAVGSANQPVYIGSDGVAVAGNSIEVDGTTVDRNGSSQLRAVAVSNKNSGDALPIWEGTSQAWTNGEATPWYYWQTSATAMWTSGGSLPSSDDSWSSIAYGDGKFVAVNREGNAAYSTDGINWTASTLPSYADWCSVTYGDNKFVTVARSSDKAAYSTDGINWTASTLPSYAYWCSVTYGDGKFVAVTREESSIAAYSTDGINWTASTLPSSGDWNSVTYGDGKFVAVDGFMLESNQAAYSTDGINWTASTLPSSGSWQSVTYGDGKFVAVNREGNAAYSTDGINWTASTLPRPAYWTSVTYGDGKFVTVAYDSNQAAYSTDGINWTETTMPSSDEWSSVTYGDGKFVAVADDNSDATAIFTMSSYDKCYTLDQIPTTSTQVYSAPETLSAKTITSTGEGTITLSDNLTYNYTPGGNQSTYRTIGAAHPSWLCNIEGVGVKKGDTLIASKIILDTTPTQNSGNGITSGAVYTALGDIETLINAL